MENKKLTLKHLSKETGYSITLLSMVLNGKGDKYGVGKKTQQMVLELAAKHGYSKRYQEVESLNVFGKAITIYVDAVITSVYKSSKEIVVIKKENQFGAITEIPIRVKDYDVTAEEFIAEFEKQNIEVYMKKIKTYINE